MQVDEEGKIKMMLREIIDNRLLGDEIPKIKVTYKKMG